MAIPKFYLRRRSQQKTNIPIELSYSFNGNRIQYSTGFRIDEKYFITDYFKSPGKLPIKKTAPSAENINDSLALIIKLVEDFSLHCKHSRHTPTVNDYRKMLDSTLKGKKTEKDAQPTLLELIDRFKDYIKTNKAHNTFRNTNSALNHLIVFCKLTKLLNASVSEINQDLCDSFRKYLINLDQKNNTVVKHLTRFRAFTTWLSDRGYSLPVIKYDLKENDIEVIVLSEKEIQLLREFDLIDQRLMRVRDIFIFGCYTGMRYGDILALQKTDVYENDIRFLIQKNGDTTNHSIPLIPETQRILNKYKDYPGSQALPCLSNQKMNQYLKELMSTIGLNEVITIAEKGGDGKISRVQKQKWELVTCHTSRKTFTTLTLSKGMGEAFIKSITGHSKNSKAFAKYYTVSDKLKQQEMAKIFNPEKGDSQ